VAANVARHRQQTGNRRGKVYGKARQLAISLLIERHRGEFESLLRLALGDLDGDTEVAGHAGDP
jgi:hypothetical protein